MAGHQEGVTLRALAADEAARALAGCSSLDPRGLMVEGDIDRLTRAGQCFELAGAANAVFVVAVRNGVAWVDAAKGSGDVDVTALLDGVITAQAEGLQAIALQTARRGLVKKLQRHGYRVAGWVLRKELTQ